MKLQTLFTNAKSSVRKNFRFATLNFLFILVYVNVFQLVFGAENSIVGVIFTIMMSASMARDLTARPIKHLLVQTFVLALMAAAACFVSNADPLLAAPVNFLMILVILYAFTYEYVSHLYFPYILSYLFLVFISPVGPEQLPKRLLSMCAGAVSIILYQLFMGRKRVVETTRDVLMDMIGEARECIRCLLAGEGVPKAPEQVRESLCKLSRMVYERRKKVLCVSDASFAMVDAGRGLENLVLLLYELEGSVTPDRAGLLEKIDLRLQSFEAFVVRKKEMGDPLFQEDFSQESGEAEQFYQCLVYIREHLLKMTQPEGRVRYRKTALSFSVRLKAAMDLCPVRCVYALRVALLLAAGTLLVQELQLPHGKWLLFTMASVSLPYSDEVGTKAKKRLLATVVGGVIGMASYALIPSPTGRTAVMMLSGYASFYFEDYAATFACSTIGALGGAVFMGAFGWQGVGSMFGVRVGYICLGILIALVANCLVFPFSRRKATRQLCKKYVNTTELLSQICRSENIDPQLYYGLIIQAHLQEDKLTKNAAAEGWDGMKDILSKCRDTVRTAHRSRAKESGSVLEAAL